MTTHYAERQSGLAVPVTFRTDLPKFTTRTFLVKYESDVEAFNRLVVDAGADWIGQVKIPFLNYKNQPVGTQYLCVYQWHKELTMEVLT